MVDNPSFADRDGVVWYDGALVEWRSAQIHVLTHGLHYASSVFEGERVYGSKVFALREHTERLVRSAAILGMKVPYSVEEICEATQKVVGELGLVDAYVRPIVWRGSESIEVSGFGTAVHVAIAAWPWPAVFHGDARTAGISLGTSTWRRPDPRTAPVTAKAAAGYTIGTLARHEVAPSFDDALMLDWEGWVAEATGANVFFVAEGVLHTPLADRFLSGITRGTVARLARQHGYEVVERRIAPTEIEHVDEVFLTGTAYEVQPVRLVDTTVFPVGSVTADLRQRYEELVRE